MRTEESQLPSSLPAAVTGQHECDIDIDVLVGRSSTGQTAVNKKAPIHYIISINNKVYRPL